uniref:BZIP domain-containing protein n=1 Tax=Steinernema glaseri TaxID=37863 RepID=A0A1I7ZW40_9BILA
MDDQQLRSLTKRKLKELKRKEIGKQRRNFNISRFRLERNLHLRHLMAQLRVSITASRLNPYKLLLPCAFQ